MHRLIDAGDDHDILHITDWLQSTLLGSERFPYRTAGEAQHLLDRIYQHVTADLKRKQATESDSRKLDRLRKMTVARGYTPAEEAAAQRALRKLMRR